MLSLGDVVIDSRSTPSVVQLALRQSKPNVFGAGITISLGRTGDILCPVSALLAYLTFIHRPLDHSFSLSRVTHCLDKPCVQQSVFPSPAGLDVSLFNGHSFRIGAATTAALAGVPDSTIKLLNRWMSSAFTRYLRLPVHSVAAVSSRLLQRLS